MDTCRLFDWLQESSFPPLSFHLSISFLFSPDCISNTRQSQMVPFFLPIHPSVGFREGEETVMASHDLADVMREIFSFLVFDSYHESLFFLFSVCICMNLGGEHTPL